MNVRNKGPTGVNADALRRLKRAEGQVGGIIRMVEEEKYCMDILNQISAARSALRKAGLSILQRHVRTCVGGAMRNDREEEGEDLINEMIRVLDRHGF